MRWNRIFFDEADSLKIPQNCKKPNAKMFWFVSSSFQNLFFSKQVLASQPLRQLPEEYIQTFKLGDIKHKKRVFTMMKRVKDLTEQRAPADIQDVQSDDE
jgi:hypothetical protein